MTVPQGDLPDYLATVGATVGQVWFDTLPAGGTKVLDVTAYNSVLIAMNNAPVPSPIVCTYQWLDAFSGVILDAGVLSANVSGAAVIGAGPSWILPVRAGTLWLENKSATALLVRANGQPAYSEWRMNHDGDPARPFQTLIGAAQPANTVFPFASTLAVNATPPFYPGATSYNGEVTLSLNTAAGTSGAIEALWPDSKGNIVSTPLLIDTGGGQRSQIVTHPRAYCTWQYTLSAASPAAAHNAFLSITPS